MIFDFSFARHNNNEFALQLPLDANLSPPTTTGELVNLLKKTGSMEITLVYLDPRQNRKHNAANETKYCIVSVADCLSVTQLNAQTRNKWAANMISANRKCAFVL